MRRTLLVAMLANLGAGCGPVAAGGSGESPILRPASYPAGPYGLKEGDTITDLAFAVPGCQTFAFEDLFKDPHNRVLLLVTTAGWCSACREEQTRLVALKNELGPRGLEVVEAIFEDNNSAPATCQLAEDWVHEYSLNFPFVADPDFELKAYYQPEFTPLNMVVDVDTMTIRMIRTGFDEQMVRYVIEADLDR